MSPARLWVLIIVALASAPAAAQPVAVLGEPTPRLPLIDLNDPLSPLGTPDTPFRPFAPLGPPPAPANEGIGTRFGLGVLAGRFGVPGYGVLGLPARPVTGQPSDLSVLRQELSVFAPIDREGCDSTAVGLGIHNTSFWTNAVLPTTHQRFPDSLWDIQAGMAYSHTWENDWTSGAVVSFGSASNEPFGERGGLVAGVTLYNAFPAEGRDAWVLGVNYSSTSDSPYPLPIAFYYWKPRDELEVGVGVPFFLKYKFLPQWTADVYWVPIRTVSATVTWQSIERPGFHAYGAFNWSNEVYYLSERQDNSDRFYSFEKRLSGGMQFDLPYKLRLDISAGYVFDRLYFTGKQYSDRNKNAVNVGAGVFGAVQLRLQF